MMRFRDLTVAPDKDGKYPIVNIKVHVGNQIPPSHRMCREME